MANPILPIVPTIPLVPSKMPDMGSDGQQVQNSEFYAIPHSDASHLNELLMQHAALKKTIYANPSLLIEPEHDLIAFNIAYDKFHEYLKKRLNLSI